MLGDVVGLDEEAAASVCEYVLLPSLYYGWLSEFVVVLSCYFSDLGNVHGVCAYALTTCVAIWRSVYGIRCFACVRQRHVAKIWNGCEMGKEFNGDSMGI